MSVCRPAKGSDLSRRHNVGRGPARRVRQVPPAPPHSSHQHHADHSHLRPPGPTSNTSSRALPPTSPVTPTLSPACLFVPRQASSPQAKEAFRLPVERAPNTKTRGPGRPSEGVLARALARPRAPNTGPTSNPPPLLPSLSFSLVRFLDYSRSFPPTPPSQDEWLAQLVSLHPPLSCVAPHLRPTLARAPGPRDRKLCSRATRGTDPSPCLPVQRTGLTVYPRCLCVSVCLFVFIHYGIQYAGRDG